MNDDEMRMKELVKKYTTIQEFRPRISGTAEEVKNISLLFHYLPWEVAEGTDLKGELEKRGEEGMNLYKRLLMYEENEYQKTDFSGIHPYTFNNACEEAMFLARNRLDFVEVRGLPYSCLLLSCAKSSWKNGNYELARMEYEKCMLWNPACVSAALNYMEFLRERGDFQEYDRVLREAFRYVYQWEDLYALFDSARTLLLETRGEWINKFTNEEIKRRLEGMGYEFFSNKDISEVLIKQGKIMEEVDERKSQECFAAANELYPKTITFGKYRRPCSVKIVENRPWEDWEWFVLCEDKEKMLLLSVDVIDWECYAERWQMDENLIVSWEQSYLRKWLNEEFYEKGFTDYEKKKILKAGNGDALYLLSAEEVEILLPKKEMRSAKIKWADHEACGHDWWADSIGSGANRRQVVDEYGVIYEAGMFVCSDEVGVRPAMWIKKSF